MCDKKCENYRCSQAQAADCSERTCSGGRRSTHAGADAVKPTHRKRHATVPKYDKRDDNEAGIAYALEAIGAHVTPLSAGGVPDLLVAYRRQFVLFEVKSAEGRLTPSQQRFFDRTEGYPRFVVSDPETAVMILQALKWPGER